MSLRKRIRRNTPVRSRPRKRRRLKIRKSATPRSVSSRFAKKFYRPWTALSRSKRKVDHVVD